MHTVALVSEETTVQWPLKKGSEKKPCHSVLSIKRCGMRKDQTNKKENKKTKNKTKLQCPAPFFLNLKALVVEQSYQF